MLTLSSSEIALLASSFFVGVLSTKFIDWMYRKNTPVIIKQQEPSEKKEEEETNEEDWEDEDDDELEEGEEFDEEEDSDPKKMLLLVRTDVGMTKGKVSISWN